MSKRAAEKQITDRDRDEDILDGGSEGDEGAAPQRIAPPAELAGRKIRGLPSRKGGAAPSAPAPAVAEGSKPPAFSFGAPSAAAPAAPKTFAGFAGFGAAPASNGSAAPASSTFSFVPSPAAPAPATVKPFSFSTSNSIPPSAAPASSSSAPSSALTYYMALRALGIAVTDAVESALQKDPFVDLGGEGGLLAELRKAYEGKRRGIVADFEKANGAGPAKASAAPTTEPATAAAAPAKSFWEMAGVPDPSKAPKPAKPAPAMPAPPAAFSFGGKAVAPAAATPASSTPVAGGFVFNASATPKGVEKSAFSLPTAPAAPPTSTGAPPKAVPTPASAAGNAGLVSSKSTPPALNAPLASSKLTNAPVAPSPLRFGQSVSPPPEEEKGEKKPFSFGATFGNIAKGAVPTTTPAPVAAAPAAKPAAFSFGTPAKTEAAGAAPAPSKAFSFGTPAAGTPGAFSFGAAATTGGIKASPPSFGFGAGLKGGNISPGGAKPNVGFSFGSPAAPAAGASTGFSFGSSAPAAASAGFSFGTSPAPAAPAASTGFTFGGFNPKPAEPAAPAAEPDAADGEGGSEDPAAAAAEPSKGNPFGGRGEGEEDESVLHEVRAKVWKLKGAEQTDLGVGVIAIKKNDKTGVKRILARNETTGNVMINFRLSESLEPTRQKTFVSFLGFDGSEPQLYRIRIKEVTDVDAFVDAVQKFKKDG